ncbi:hypothetical protein BDV95DRAFT_560535 [Massariosphaeria phaeospora]|uniref:F-box domain-containing protein n=1 Tax=Massariosphaeria phaeospora TaxID=100035 RepID=A0A7C8IGY3_9PLEO|nr:hypothetical protein BDV95DRAFT_560535 [Massariosphaeria phaeospora]
MLSPSTYVFVSFPISTPPLRSTALSLYLVIVPGQARYHGPKRACAFIKQSSVELTSPHLTSPHPPPHPRPLQPPSTLSPLDTPTSLIMAPKALQLSSSPLDRESSPELGSPSRKPQYNKQTGRPIRRGAGQAKNREGYVDSVVIEEDEPVELPSEDEDGEIVKPKRSAKRKRSPSPTPPPLEPIIYDEPPDEASDEDTVGMFHHNAPAQPIVLQFNVPLGYHGPLRVTLDRNLLQNSSDAVAQDMKPRGGKLRKLGKSTTKQGKTAVVVPRKGFTDLPPELRNKCYRHLFVADGEFSFPAAQGLSRSAQFLRTCKLVHSEGCSILYGENTFSFDRNRNTRGPFWEPVLKEIGYKDIRQFLKVIGPENLAYLRDIKFAFEDASPAATHYLKSHEERRYLNDDHLIDCLRILREAKLRKLTLSFYGRRTLLKTDVKFLGYLEQIKADEITTTNLMRYYFNNKIHQALWDDLKQVMVRKTKLYIME